MIPQGNMNARTVPQIAAQHGTSERAVKKEMERLRIAGAFIVADRATGGVYITDDPTEALASIVRYQRQANTMERLVSRMRRAYDVRFGARGKQTAFELEVSTANESPTKSVKNG